MLIRAWNLSNRIHQTCFDTFGIRTFLHILDFWAAPSVFVSVLDLTCYIVLLVLCCCLRVMSFSLAVCDVEPAFTFCCIEAQPVSHCCWLMCTCLHAAPAVCQHVGLSVIWLRWFWFIFLWQFKVMWDFRGCSWHVLKQLSVSRSGCISVQSWWIWRILLN